MNYFFFSVSSLMTLHDPFCLYFGSVTSAIFNSIFFSVLLLFSNESCRTLKPSFSRYKRKHYDSSTTAYFEVFYFKLRPDILEQKQEVRINY